MRIYAIHYAPIWGQMTRYIKYVKAFNTDMAITKFYCSSDAENCAEILYVEPC